MAGQGTGRRTGGIVALRTRRQWERDGRPARVAQPLDQLGGLLRRYGYTVYFIGNDAHLRHDPPEDHTPFSATGWPIESPYGWIFAADIMPPKAGSGLPSLAALGMQLVAARQANKAAVRWLKYINWEPAGPGGPCWHESWTPEHRRRPSSDRGHIHLSARSDHAQYTGALGYDPVKIIREGAKNAGDDVPADWSRRLLMSLPTLRSGATGKDVRRLQALVNVDGGELRVDGDLGPATVAGVRAVQRRAGLPASGVVDPRTWAALLGEKL